MPATDPILAVFRFNILFAKRLASDIPEDQMTQQPAPGMNHACWILGHLTMLRLWLKDILKLDVTVPPDWVEKFNQGTKPLPDRALYPTKADLLAALDQTQTVIEVAVKKLSDADLAAPNPNDRMKKIFPTTLDLLTGLLAAHQAFHQGQLSAWRRAMGMPAVSLP